MSTHEMASLGIAVYYLFLSPVATVIVEHGTLKVGDVLVGGRAWARIRALLGEGRQALKEASPSTPVLTVGWKEVPTAGDECIQVSLLTLTSGILQLFYVFHRLIVSSMLDR